MNLNEILTQINQTTQKENVKTLQKPRFKVEDVSKYFIEQLNKSILQSTLNEHSLILSDDNTKVIQTLIEYICVHPTFLKRGEGFSFRKGILLMGNFGSGKTEIMKTYKAVLDKANIKCGLMTTTDINTKYNEYNDATKRILGEKGIQVYLSPEDKTERIFDDLGAEAFLNDYGNKKSIMIEILEARYRGRAKGVKTHLTTNLSLDELRDKYGDRMYSRFKEMFNVVVLGGADGSIDFRR